MPVTTVEITEVINQFELTVDETTTVVETVGESLVTITDLALQGLPGADGVGAAFEHTQTIESTEWIVNHNLGYKPATEIYSTGGAEVDAEVLHLSNNQLRVYTIAPKTGFLRCI